MKFLQGIRQEAKSRLFWISCVAVAVILILAAMFAKTSYSWIFTIISAIAVREAVSQAYEHGRLDAYADELAETARRDMP